MKEIQYNTTELNRMMAFLENQVKKDTEEHKIFSSFIDLQKKRFHEEWDDKNRPFLSVITRTQGKRPDMLTETLLCLAGQQDTDFELIVVGHNLNQQQYKTVSEIIDELPDWMKKQTRYLPVDGGTRTTPLNRGFEEANGKYIAILDDDDIVFDNWVEKFKEFALKNPGKVIHSYVIYQDWETVSSKYPNTPISINAPSGIFCKDYLFGQELVINVCPPVGLAFPAYSFKYLNIRFDEELTTNEDWDFLTRTTFVTGIVNNPTPTCIYRNWLNTENSQTVHKKEEWDKNYWKIVNRFKSIPALYDQYSMEEYIKENSNSDGGRLLSDSTKLYYDVGNGFCEGNSVRSTICDEEHWSNSFINLEQFGEFKAIRIDPCEKGNVVLDDLRIKIYFSDGTEKIYEKGEILTNAYDFNGRYVFLKNDPQFIICFNEPKKINKVVCNLEITTPIPDAIVDALVGERDVRKPLVYRILRKVWRKFKRIIAR